MLSSSDLRLARRIEEAEALNVARIAEAMREVSEETAVEAFAGGVAIFAGVGSPMTHAVGIGMSGSVADCELTRMEAFFEARGSATVIDLCPLADESVMAYVQRRTYRVMELNNVMVRAIGAGDAVEVVEESSVREIGPQALEQWARVISTAFSDPMPVSAEAVRVMVAGCRECRCWLAGEGEAGAAMSVRSDVALFTGDATISAARRKGRQLQLIAARLRAAQEVGCKLAVASVLPGTTSHRNYERSGFGLVYMRVNVASAAA